MTEPWEQQPEESDPAFNAFVAFREMPHPRTVLGAYRRTKPGLTVKRPSSLWPEWCRLHKWIDRALAYDTHISRMRGDVRKRVVAEVTEQRVREIELSALNTLKETAALAHSRITDILTWDADGKVTVKASDQIPDHAIGAIAKVKQTFDRKGQPHLDVELHGKTTPVDLLGRHFRLWDEAKEQAQKAQTHAFLDFLAFIKSGAMDREPWDGPEPSLLHPPDWIAVDIPGVTKK